MKRAIIALILAMSLLSVSYISVPAKDITVTGIYTSQDGRVNDRKFNIELTLKDDNTFIGKIDSWMGLYMTDGSEKVHFMKEKVDGSWKVNKNTIILKENNRKIPLSARFDDVNGMKVIVEK